ncbi:DNA-directed RNA polymerase subunit G [Stetteria hydrogenophila]
MQAQVAVELEGRVESVEPGRLKGQSIVTVRGDGFTVRFDAIEGLVSFSVGDELRLVFTESKPGDLDRYDFCGHGYLVMPEEEAGKTLFSVWGIIFAAEPPLGLRDGVKYYLCIEKKR